MPRGKQIQHDLRQASQNGGSKWETARNRENRGNLLWEHAGAEDLLLAVASATEDGAAVLLSKTSDGGALVIQILTGSGTHKWYPASGPELIEALMEIVEIAKL